MNLLLNLFDEFADGGVPVERTWVTVLVIIGVVLLILAIILVPIIKKQIRKRKGLKPQIGCANCSVGSDNPGKRAWKKFEKKNKVAEVEEIKTESEDKKE